MVRNFPTGPTPRNNSLLSHTFLIAFVAATIAIVSFLCGKKKRKRSLSSNNHTTTTSTDDTSRLLVSTTDTRTNEGIPDNNDDPPPPPEKALPPPPRLANIRAASYHIAESSSRTHGAKLTSSLSMRLSGGLKGLKKGPNKDEKRSNQTVEVNDKLTREDSVWKKTIILGEKCRIPDEDEEDIILDENGQRITTFHRKQSCSSSMSRRSSDVNQDVIRN